MSKGAFDIPWIKELTKLISSKLHDNFEWLVVPQHGGGIRLLDYACGNGIVSMVSIHPSAILPPSLLNFRSWLQQIQLTNNRRSFPSLLKPSASTSPQKWQPLTMLSRSPKNSSRSCPPSKGTFSPRHPRSKTRNSSTSTLLSCLWHSTTSQTRSSWLKNYKQG